MRAGVYFCIRRMSVIINTMNTIQSIEMKNNERLFYEAPSTKVFEVRFEGMVCTSNRYNGFGNEDDLS